MLQPLLILLVSVLLGAAAQLFLKRGVLDLENFSLSFNNFFNLIQRVLQNIWLVSGLFLFGVSFLFWLLVLSRFKLSSAYPISTSLNFIFIALFSWLFLKEQLALGQVLGISVIILGIFLLLRP